MCVAASLHFIDTTRVHHHRVTQVCQSKTDYDALYDFINTNSGFKTINLQNAETLKGKGKCLYDAAKLSQMRKLGVRNTLDSFVEAPPAIMEILYGHHQIHNVVLALRA